MIENAAQGSAPPTAALAGQLRFFDGLLRAIRDVYRPGLEMERSTDSGITASVETITASSSSCSPGALGVSGPRGGLDLGFGGSSYSRDTHSVEQKKQDESYSLRVSADAHNTNPTILNRLQFYNTSVTPACR
eukprot:GHVU01159538.1.p1 GENE.GHVU01159538.1~~GHVU01159538.1.p1  ORF type:complete len:133 (-),score=3.92 GHVU01159538.1:14-412(-)